MVVQPLHPCDSRIRKTESNAANTGIVATAVSTTITEVSFIPSVKVTELIAKANITIIPGQLKIELIFFSELENLNSCQNIKRVSPIKMPLHPINGHRSRFENLITIVSGVRIKTPIKARKFPKLFGRFLKNRFINKLSFIS